MAGLHSWEVPDPPSPLPNSFSNCYLNALCQVLLVLPRPRLLCAQECLWKEIFACLERDPSSLLHLYQLLSPELRQKFPLGRQACAAEFYALALLPLLPRSWATLHLFRNVEILDVCLQCSRTQRTHEPSFYTLTLPIHHGPQTISLHTLIAQWFQPASVDDARCKTCQTVGSRTRQWSFGIWPKILHIHLLRAQSRSQRKGDWHAVRNCSSVLIPLACSFGNRTYELMAVLLHHGVPALGHYIALVKKRERWYLCNDQEIHEKELAHVKYLLQSDQTHLLWYLQRDLKPTQ